MEIDEFIAARLTDELEAAEAAISDQWAHWRVGRHQPRHLYVEAGLEATDDGVPIGTLDRGAQAIHAARQDPAATLARVVALRALVALHGEWVDSGTCQSCGDCPQIPYPCDTLRHVAAIWSWHPDYRAEWAPSA